MRTKEEIMALWPKTETYKIVGKCIIKEATTEIDAARQLQILYDGLEAVAGEFQVRDKLGVNTFRVEFIRDVPDDYDVLEDKLKNSDLLFCHAVVNQLRLEIENAVEANHGAVDLTVVNLMYVES